MATEKAEPVGEIYGAMCRVMRDVKFVPKARRNEQQHYQFRGIDEIYGAVHEVMARQGVFVLPDVKEQKREPRETKSGGMLTYTILTVRHTFYAADGSSVEAITVGEAMDSGDKSSNKAMSAAMKYALIEAFLIPVDEPIDTENQSPEPVARQTKQPAKSQAKPPAEPIDQKATPQQLEQMRSLITRAGLTDEKIKKLFDDRGIEAWDQMSSADIAKCIARAETIIKKGKAA